MVCHGFHSRVVWCEAEPEFNDAALCHHGVWAHSSARLVESLWDDGLLCDCRPSCKVLGFAASLGGQWDRTRVAFPMWVPGLLHLPNAHLPLLQPGL